MNGFLQQVQTNLVYFFRLISDHHQSVYIQTEAGEQSHSEAVHHALP